MVGHGHGAVLALLLGVLVAVPVPVVTVVLVALATAVRWGSPWLVAIGGAQGVLGPGGLVGPPLAAASAWLAAAALVLVVPGRTIVGGLATGVTAAFLVAGPAGDEGGGVRVLGTAAAVVVALLVSYQPRRRLPALVGVGLAVVATGLAVAA